MSSKSTIWGTPSLVVERMKHHAGCLSTKQKIQTRPPIGFFLPITATDIGNVVDLRILGGTPGRHQEAEEPPSSRSS